MLHFLPSSSSFYLLFCTSSLHTCITFPAPFLRLCSLHSRKMSESRMEFRLKNTPNDCIQSVKFGPSSSQFLLVASWDKSVRLFDVNNNNMRLQYQHSGPVLDCCFQAGVRQSGRRDWSIGGDFPGSVKVETVLCHLVSWCKGDRKATYLPFPLVNEF